MVSQIKVIRPNHFFLSDRVDSNHRALTSKVSEIDLTPLLPDLSGTQESNLRLSLGKAL